jgi:hypothetical protein
MLAVVARVALFDDGPAVDAAELVCRLVHLVGHERVRRQQVVGGDEVADDVRGCQSAVFDVVAHALQGRAVPRVEVHLAVALAEVRRERRVVDQEVAGREGAEVPGRSVAHEGDFGVPREFGDRRPVLVEVGEHPGVREVREIG